MEQISTWLQQNSFWIYAACTILIYSTILDIAWMIQHDRKLKGLKKLRLKIDIAVFVIVIILQFIISGMIVTKLTSDLTSQTKKISQTSIANNESEKPADDNPNRKEIKRELYTITVPRNFEDLPKDAMADGADIGMGNFVKEIYVQTIVESASDFADNMSVVTYCKLAQDATRETVDDMKLTQLDNQIVKNPYSYDKADYKFTASYDNLPVVYYMRCVKHDDSYFIIYSWTLAKYESRNRSTMIELTESFLIKSKSQET